MNLLALPVWQKCQHGSYHKSGWWHESKNLVLIFCFHTFHAWLMVNSDLVCLLMEVVLESVKVHNTCRFRNSLPLWKQLLCMIHLPICQWHTQPNNNLITNLPEFNSTYCSTHTCVLVGKGKLQVRVLQSLGVLCQLGVRWHLCPGSDINYNPEIHPTSGVRLIIAR